MSSLDNNIEALSRAMVNEAKAEAEQVLAEAQTKADAIRASTQEQAAKERKEILERARQEAERLRSQVIATTQMKARTSELEHREKLLDSVFEVSQSQLRSIQQWTDYGTIALRLLKEALVQLKAKKAVVRADALTLSYYSEKALAEISSELGIELTLGEKLGSGTGVTVETPDGHLQFDNTLETRLSRLQNNLRSPVYRLLIGEKL
jgi:V/A-type H+/Na+-transporting ATPase subunit E